MKRSSSRLKCAAMSGDLKLVKCVMAKESYPKPTHCNKLEELPLMLAVKYGHVEIAEWFLDYGIPADEVNVAEVTPLHYAARSGKFSCVKLLLERGAHVNQVVDFLDGRTPLHSAVRSGNADIAKLLLESGADVNIAAGHPPRTPQQLAAELGYLDCYKLLEKRNCKTVKSALRAALNGHLCIVQYYVEKGGDVNAKDLNEMTLIHEAARNGHTSVVQYLLDVNAKVRVEDKLGNTPLHYATQNGHTETSLLLLNREAELKTQTDKIWKILAVESMMFDYVEHFESIENWCKQLGIPIADEKEGNSLLHTAAKYDSVDIAGVLLQKGADVNAKNLSGMLPLEFSICYSSERVAELLLNSGASLCGIKDEKRNALIIISARNNMPSVVGHLVDLGTNINKRGIEGKTPLHIACEHGFGAVVSKLIDAGADFNSRDSKGNTPLNAAARRRHRSLIYFLLRKGAQRDTGGVDQRLLFKNYEDTPLIFNLRFGIKFFNDFIKEILQPVVVFRQLECERKFTRRRRHNGGQRRYLKN